MDSEQVQAATPKPGTGSRALRQVLVALVCLVATVAAAYLLYSETQTWRRSRYPYIYAVAPKSAKPKYAVSGAAKKETERLGKPAAPVTVQASLPSSPCVDIIRAMLRDAAQKHGDQGLYVEIYNPSSPEGHAFNEQKKVHCATVFVGGTAVQVRHGMGGDQVRAAIDKAVAEAQGKKAESSNRTSATAKKGA
jgi:hypothetical protein